MAQVAVNKQGDEIIGHNLVRCRITKLQIDPADEFNLSKDQCGFWCSLYDDSDGFYVDISIKLPHGSIKKLIGRALTWDDEPVEI